MDCDEKYDNMDYSTHPDESVPDKDSAGGIDPRDIANPVRVYFFLSDDAQRSGGPKIKR